MQKNILIKKKTAKKIMVARQKAIQKEKAEKYWEKVKMHEDGCVAARQMELEKDKILYAVFSCILIL